MLYYRYTGEERLTPQPQRKMQTTTYYREQIKELADNFNPAEKKAIFEAMNEAFVDTKKLNKLYDELMADVYGDNGIKGY